MYTTKHLDIKGYRNEPVLNTFFQQDAKTLRLAVVFPGVNYTCQMPLLYYSTHLLLSKGADVLQVEASYGQHPEFGSTPQEEREKWFTTDVSATLHAGLNRRKYGQLILVGKSLGTLALGYLLATEKDLPRTQAIWLTPLLRDDTLRGQIKDWGGSSMFVIGSADEHYETMLLLEVQQATNGNALVINQADHHLEMPSDVTQSLRNVEEVMSEIDKFLW